MIKPPKFLCLYASFFSLLMHPFSMGEQDYFGREKEPTGLSGNLFDLKNDFNLKPTPVSSGGGVKMEEFYKAFDGLVEQGFSEEALAKYSIGDETCNFEYMALRTAPADKVPAAFGSPYIDPRGVVILYEGEIEKAPTKEFRFAGAFDDAMAVVVNGKCVFYNSFHDVSKLKSKELSKRKKETKSKTADVYGEFITLKKGDKVKIAFAEVPGGNIGGALKVELKRFNYDEDDYDDPILHPFVARKVKRDLEDELEATGIKLELKRIPEFIFKLAEE
ncbi:hypothetical protein ACFPK9_11275 [Rubritalea spongiae]|uniref:Uncharacterized protein n=1 Tax=Rubritalea spongiae TaxID=430797 RepID=A0ABW5DZQ3_9BACT